MIYHEVPGGAELLRWFGRAPSFHDAEVLSLDLRRKRVEAGEGAPRVASSHVDAIRQTLERLGVEFFPENGGEAGVRLRERPE